MHIKSPDFGRMICGAVCLMSVFSLAGAAPRVDGGSPYRINTEVVPGANQAVLPSAAQPVSGASYQLDTKYRLESLQQEPKVKAATPTSGLQLSWLRNPEVPGKFSDFSAPNPKLAEQPFFAEIELAARAASLDPALVHAVVFVESRYRRHALSTKGAIGLMQVLPDTAARYGIKDAGTSPKANLRAGTLYLRDLMHMYDNRIDLALAAYNAGEGAVAKYSGQIPPYRETRQYVLAVMAKYNEWRKLEVPEPVVASRDTEVELPSKPAQIARIEYLAGTRLADSDDSYTNGY